uniref:Uncharacterized protein n=1 Tax=Arundo donax TaxID=35708 RepID=A0A0A9BDQ6_ARUDO
MAAATWYLVVWESTNGARLVHPLTRVSSTRRRDNGVRRYTPSPVAGASRARIPVAARNLIRRGRYGLLCSGTGTTSRRSGIEAAPPRRWMALGIPRSTAHCSAADLR